MTRDKVAHLTICCAISFIGAAILRLLGLHLAPAIVVALYVSILIGIAKEFYDVYNSRDWARFGWKDLLADVEGAVIGFFLALVIVEGVFDIDEFLRFFSGCLLICVWLGVMGFAIIQAIIKQ